MSSLAARRVAMELIRAALDAVEPGAAVRKAVRRAGAHLAVADRIYDLDTIRRVVVVGGGKAAVPMARAVESILGDRIVAGVVVTKDGHGGKLSRIEIAEAAHPVPDERSVAGAQRVLDTVSGLTPDDLVICLISGGGSALLAAPAPGITLTDKQRLTDALLRAGATIGELNAVRKHLSAIKGGRLAQAAAPARVVSLLLSDVVGDPLDVIASGPTAVDPSTYRDALEVIYRRRIPPAVAPGAIRLLERGAAGEQPETLDPDDPVVALVQNVVVASNEVAAGAAVDRAGRLGYGVQILTTSLEGEASQVGGVFGAIARELERYDRPLRRPACLVAGGETTVTVRGSGRGGRNQELALGASLALAGTETALVAAFATDGGDGPTEAAGAFADGTTVRRASELGRDIRRHLEDNDSNSVLRELGDLIVTGPTRTNVNDLVFVIAPGPAETSVELGP
ncbi:MAG: glycerate kinase [Chloroflexi bacterium]|nr:glycerate kinase [Chloroflexota bacterium]